MASTIVSTVPCISVHTWIESFIFDDLSNQPAPGIENIDCDGFARQNGGHGEFDPDQGVEGVGIAADC